MKKRSKLPAETPALSSRKRVWSGSTLPSPEKLAARQAYAANVVAIAPTPPSSAPLTRAPGLKLKSLRLTESRPTVRIVDVKPSKPAKTKKAKQHQPAPPTTAPRAVSSPPPLDAIRVKHRLVLDDNQKSRLEGLFLAPKAVAALLRAYPKPLVTKADASLFLLSNRKALDGYINPDARGHSVDLLTELLLQWSGNPPETVGIDFDDVSLTQDHKVYLPLDGLRNLEVENVQELLSQRKGRRFKQPFTVFEKNKQFFIALTLEPIQVPRVAPSAPAKMPQARATAQTTKSPIALKPLEPAPPPPKQLD